MIPELWLRLDEELRRLKPYRWLAAGLAALIFIVGAAYVSRLPDVYDAWGQVYIPKATPISVAASGLSATGAEYGGAYVVQRTLLGDRSLAHVLQALEPASPRASQAETAAAVARLRRNIRLVDSGDGFVEFHFVDTDPARARATVQALLDLFISTSVSRSHRDLGKAETFLDDQLAEMEAPLARSSARLAALRARHADLSAMPLPTREVEGDAPVVAAPLAAPAAPRPSAAGERLATLKARLAALLDVYTDAYPDVIAVRRQIAAATAEARDERDAPGMASASGAPARLLPRHRRVRTGPAPASPALVAEYKDAVREDGALRDRYQELANRREAARMSSAVYGADVAGKFEVTRDPVTPLTPTGPNRGLYLAAAAAIAAGGGFAAAYLLAALRGVVVSPREVTRLCQLPVVATVSRTRAWTQVRRPPAASPERPRARERITFGVQRLAGERHGRAF